MDKKLFVAPFFALSMLVVTGCNNKQTADNNDKTEAVDDSTITDKHWGAHLNGIIGSANDCDLSFFDGEGGFSYSFNPGVKASRVVKMDSYDAASGRLILSCNDVNGGKYTGSYNGILKKHGTAMTYKGIYTNYKGVEIKFDLKGQYLTHAVVKKVEVIEWDKVTCEVKGPVKKIVQNSWIINFSKEGKITSWTGWDEKMGITREHGRITSIGQSDFGETFSYDIQRGRLKKIDCGGEGGGMTETYIYDGNGNVTNIKVKGDELNDYGDQVVTTNATFAVKEVKDSHGNWISRTYNGNTTTRKITYYE